jgi:hypothetical protein
MSNPSSGSPCKRFVAFDPALIDGVDEQVGKPKEKPQRF